MKSCYGQRDRMSRGGMSPLRLFTRNNAPRKSENVDEYSGIDGRGARHPLCPITDVAIGQSNEEACIPESKVEKSTSKAKGKCSCIAQEKFPHLENSEGMVNSVSVTSEKPATSASVLQDGANLNSKRKFAWQRRHAITNGRDGFPHSITPPRAYTSCALTAVSQGAYGQCSGTQQLPSSVEREDQRGGRYPSDTPGTVRAPEGKSVNETETGGSQSRTAMAGNNVSRALKYSQQQASSSNSGATGPASACSGCLQNVVALPPGQLEAVESLVPQSLNHIFAEQHFELEEDPNFWRDHNVQVLIRIRPINASEVGAQGRHKCLKQESPHTLCWLGQPESRFTFDHVVGEAVTQARLFEVAGLPVVENCMQGYNSCMFAYGQTGSGKTHTMLGDVDGLDFSPSQNRGMTPRVFEHLFGRIRTEEETRRQEHLKFSCKCSFLEIYNEHVTDLLEPSSTNLQMREDAKKGVYVENLLEVEVQGVQDIIQLILQGAANRRVAATNMNRESSRSHSVFTCVVESKWEANSMTNSRYGRLHLVDLAGSERQKSSGAEGGRLRESANINKSLSTLGLVIMILVDVANGKQRHVPYRDSKLTFLLQDSLGGNSKTIMIANISPSSCCAVETLSTLKFAQRAKFIRNNAVVNEDASGDVSALRQQIEDLKVEVSRLRHGTILRTPSSTYLTQQLFAHEESEDKFDEPATTDNFESGRSSLGVTCKSTAASTRNSDKNSGSAEELMQGEQLTNSETKIKAAEIGGNVALERFESKQGVEDDVIRITESDHKRKRLNALDETLGHSKSVACGDVLSSERSRMYFQRRGGRVELPTTQPLPEVSASSNSLEKICRTAGKKEDDHQLKLEDDVNDADEVKFLEAGSKSTIDNVEEVEEEPVQLTEDSPISVRRMLRQQIRRGEGLRAQNREKDMKILSGRKDMELAMANLKDAELEIGKVHTDKGRLIELISANRIIIDRVSSKLKGTEEELRNRGVKIERCEAELRKMAVILYDWEIKMHDVEKIEWRKENEAFAEELTQLKVTSIAKGSDAAFLRQKFEDGPPALKESSGLIAAMGTENGNGQHERTDSQYVHSGQRMTVPMMEKSALVLTGTETHLRTQQHDIWVNCRDALVSLAETMDGLSLATQEITTIWNSHHQEMEHLRKEMDAWKEDLVAGFKLPSNSGQGEDALLQEQEDKLMEVNFDHEYEPRPFQSGNVHFESFTGIGEATKDLTSQDLVIVDIDTQQSVSTSVPENTVYRLSETGIKGSESLGKAHDSESEAPRVSTSVFEEGTAVSPDCTRDFLKGDAGDRVPVDVLDKMSKSPHEENALLAGDYTSNIVLRGDEEQLTEDCLLAQVIKEDTSYGQVDKTDKIEALSEIKSFRTAGNFKCSNAACVSDLLTLKRVFRMEDKVVEQLKMRIKLMRAEVDRANRTKLQNVVHLMGTQGALGDELTNATYQMGTCNDEVSELEMVVKAMQADVNSKKDAVWKAIELILDKLEMGVVGGKFCVSAEKRQCGRTSLLRGLEEGSKNLQRALVDTCLQGRDDKPENNHEKVASLEQRIETEERSSDAEKGQGLHEDYSTRDRAQIQQQTVAELERQVTESKVPSEILTEKGSDELLRLSKTDLTFLNETLMSALAVCETYVSELPDLFAQFDELGPMSGLAEVSETFLINVKEIRKDVTNFGQVAEKGRDHLNQRMYLVVEENKQLSAEVQHLQSKILALNDELEQKRLTEILADDLLLDEKNSSRALKMMTSRLMAVESDREKIQRELLLVNEQLQATEKIADERAIVSKEARQVAELSAHHAEEKEEEARILGRSVEELESTVYVLESQLGILSGEVERQRAAREVLEKESEDRKQEMASLHEKIDSQQAQILKDAHHAGTAKTELDRIVIEMKAQQFHTRRSVECLQQECAEKDVQLRSCKAHIADLIFGAEKQASENHVKLKTLESMAEKLRVEDWKSGSVGKVVEKLNPSKGRRPGSPFRCLSSGLQQPRSSEYDEELAAAKRKIKELEAGAASRQKEIFMLNTKLAEAESMTHDVVRDLLGVKTDITSYATLLTQHQKQQMSERARFRTFEAQQLPGGEASLGCGCSSVR